MYSPECGQTHMHRLLPQLLPQLLAFKKIEESSCGLDKVPHYSKITFLTRCSASQGQSDMFNL